MKQRGTARRTPARRVTSRRTACAAKVDRRANKIQVRHAVEELFDVEVASVHIVNRKGKPIMRYGRVANHRPAVRKAYVKLAPGSKNLEFFEGV